MKESNVNFYLMLHLIKSHLRDIKAETDTTELQILCSVSEQDRNGPVSSERQMYQRKG